MPALHTRPTRRIVCAMSGGVDSSVAALLLKRAGHEVVGLFMRNGVHVEESESRKKSCCSVSDARDARMVAARLELPFQAVDLSEEFGAIIRYFVREYELGRTPNPCAVCNRDLKFDRLLRFAEDLGAEGVATGHYAQIELVDGRVHVRRGLDRGKDQSYQLFCVAEANLARTHLPIGGLEKREVRRIAEEAGLRTAKKADSQEICFVPSNDYRRMHEERGAQRHPGQIVDTAGRLLGEHEGTERFTIGQRRGLGVAGGEPLYVVATDPDTGTVVLGTADEALFTALEVDQLNWIGVEPRASLRCLVQHRYRCVPAPATVEADGTRARVVFDEPQAGVAPGQGAAFYDGERLLGGGWIGRTERVGRPGAARSRAPGADVLSARGD